MCGFIGNIGKNSDKLYETAYPEVALRTLTHRGPDDSGVWWNEAHTVFLGHRRLSIIDLSPAGRQPMTNEDGTLRLVYNGEIYNYQELKSELSKKGHRFISSTDSEVILHGYEEFGVSVVERLRGMFSFALYDSVRECLLLARDRVGIKPLYYTIAGDTLYFASEIKALLIFPDIRKELDTEALNEYLVFGKVYPPATMFRGIFKLPAGCVARWDSQEKLVIDRYWTPYKERMDFHPDADEAWHTAHLRKMLEESVRLRMISDVPVGVFLSGGVDSTTNVALMSEVSGSRVHTFTAGFQGQAAYDERNWARKAAAHYGTMHEECEVTPKDLTELLPELSWYLDEPVADPTVIPIYFVSRLAREKNAIVILNGDGADELFCGYRRYARYRRYRPAWRALGLLPGAVKRGAASLNRLAGGAASLSELLERSAAGTDFYVGATSALKNLIPFRDLLPAQSFRPLFRAVDEARGEFAAIRRSRSYAEWLSYWGLRSEVENVFLYRADRMGMANSIEIRVPFLDHKIVEYAMQMPQELKWKNGEPKYILKKAVETLVPREFLQRKKQGFCVPIREWSGGLMNDKIFRVLPRMREDWGVLREGFLERAKGALAGADPDGAAAFDLYLLAAWYERWFLS